MPTLPSVFDALGLIADFDDALLDVDASSSETRRQMFVQHLQKMDKLNYVIPDFQKDLDWLNVSESLSMNGNLKGQLIVLDFFTYCCINCMHILPDLEVLEERHPTDTGVVVIGVHSAKFLNEKMTANILSAVLRYNIHHPIVNDSEANLWQELSIACWPTLVFVGPSGQLLYSLAGEGHLAKILEFIEIAKEHYTNLDQLKPKPVPMFLEMKKRQKSVLNFPGKIKFWKEHSWLVITDSGHHRLIVTDLFGIVHEVIGSGNRGFKDGNFSEASFSSPQGIACWKHFIYVADTENHCMRLVDLSKRQVLTLTGTGKQGLDKEGGKTGTLQEISSPWDVVLGHSPQRKDTEDPDVLYIAMAGTHQIWVYFLKDATWYKDKHFTKGTSIRFAGSGLEENRNNSYPEKASFAQPSGLILCNSKDLLYIADSESSSVRSLSLKDGKVAAVVGGERDPMNLFAFGDVDGKGINAKLQHPLGVALQSADGPLLIADSYNHKIKIVDVNSLECTTLAGTGQSGSELNQSDLTSCQLNEPGGITCDESDGKIYVADTNNHAIKIINISHKSMSELPIIFPKETQPSDIEKKTTNDDLKVLPPLTLPAIARSLTLTFNVNIPEGHHFNLEAPNRFRIEYLDGSDTDFSELVPHLNRKGNIDIPKMFDKTDGKLSIDIRLAEKIRSGTYRFNIHVQYFLCLDEGNVCLPPITCTFQQIVNILTV